MCSLVSTFKEVFRDGHCTIIIATVFIGVFFLALWMPNLTWIRDLLASSDFSGATKVRLVFSSFDNLGIGFAEGLPVITFIIALLFAIHTSFVAYYFKKRANAGAFTGVGIIGMLTGLLGIGCAACGSVLLSLIIGAGATAGFIGFLPLRGQEFGLVGIGMLGLSIFVTAKKIKEPVKCK